MVNDSSKAAKDETDCARKAESIVSHEDINTARRR